MFSRERNHRGSTCLNLVATASIGLLAGGAATAATGRGYDGQPVRGYDQYTGPYAQFGIGIGATEGDDGAPDTDAQGGFTLTGGYRVSSWLSGEINFTFLEGELDGFDNDVQYFSFTFGPKLYPLALAEQSALPETVQPYLLIAIGGGEYEVEDTRFDEGTFIARFIFGFDWWATDQIGAFVEGGYHVASEDDITGSGLFTFGAQYRF